MSGAPAAAAKSEEQPSKETGKQEITRAGTSTLFCGEEEEAMELISTSGERGGIGCEWVRVESIANQLESESVVSQ